MMRSRLSILLLLSACLTFSSAAHAASPPPQPDKGPGGADSVASEIVKRTIGTASAGTYVFHAAGATEQPRPVAVFLHSWGAADPMVYGGWIDHLARKGYLVLYPRFQDVNRSRPADAPATAARLVHEALEALAADADAKPDLQRVAYIGHLAGVPIALDLAADAESNGLPVPKLIFAAMPGGIASDDKARGIQLQDLSALDPSILLIALSGDRDYLPIDRTAHKILKEATGIPASRKLFVRVVSDDHGFPALTAALASPGSPKPGYEAAGIKVQPDPPRDPKQKNPWRWSADMALTGEQTILTAQLGANPTDTLDYLAFWKTFDMAAEAAFSGQDAAFLRRDPKFVDMGVWSDGWPVRRLSAEMPKAEGEEDKSTTGTRTRLNLGPSATQQTLSELLGKRS